MMPGWPRFGRPAGSISPLAAGGDIQLSCPPARIVAMADLLTALPTATALDPDQRQAVEHGDGPCLVLAGPGTGKTRVIVERFLALLRRGVEGDRQLVLTYTRKAADEMRGRAEDALHGSLADVPLTNYHSFALRVVRDWGWLLGISPAVRIADAAERWMHAEAVLEELRPRTLWNALRPHDLMDQLLDVIGTAKQELVTPERYAQWAAERLGACEDPVARALLERQTEVAEVYARLDQRYRRLGVFDHDDSILYAERLIREHPAARTAVAGRIGYVMVDEFQDTNYAQAKLVDTLVAGHRNILVVADDDQSIYKFRGASRANLDRFSRTYAGHRTITLTHNYRSTAEIVSAARAVIGLAALVTRIDKQLVAERGGGTAVEIWSADEGRSESMAVAAECRRLIAAGTRPAGIAWLFRKHIDMQPAMHALRECGVPYQVSGGRGFFQEREIKDAWALLSAAADPEDSQAVLRCLHLPAWQIGGSARAALARAARDHDVPLITLITDATVEGITAADAERAGRCIAAVIELHSVAQREDVRDVFYTALDSSEFLGILDASGGQERLQMGANLNKFGELLEDFADWSDDRSVARALHYLSILRDSREAGELAPIATTEDGVVLLTAHGAKGLEWPVVFIARCTRDRWSGRSATPSSIELPDELVPEPAPPGDAAIDEERRLFFVAATRARDRLILTWARRYPRSFSDQERTPFVDGLGFGTAAVQPVDVPRAASAATRPRRTPGTPRVEPAAVSVSDVRAFKLCPRRYEYDRRWRLPVRSSVQSWYGTLMHQVLHTAAMQRSAGVAVDGPAVAALWQQAWETSRGPKGAHARLRADGEEQLRRYVESDSWTRADIRAAEESFTIPVGAGTEVTGRFDRVDNGADGLPTVVDYKTGPTRDDDALRRDLQVRAYGVALSQREDSDQVAVELHYLKVPEVTRMVFDRKFLNNAFSHLSASARDLLEAVSTGDFPAKPSRWQCPRCDFRMVCDEGRSAFPN
jgi:DNA helicase-2/ATP-dependent DNA helicase PcrA